MTGSSRSRRRSRHCSPPASTASSRRNARRSSARPSSVSASRWRRSPRSFPPRLADRLPQLVLALVRKELVRPDPPARVGRGGISLSPRAHPRGSLRASAEGDAGGAARALRRLARGAVGEPSGELEETIGYHLEQACRHYGELGLVRRSHAPARAPRRRPARLGRTDWPSTVIRRSQAACSNARSRCCRPMTPPASSCCPSWPRRSSWPASSRGTRPSARRRSRPPSARATGRIQAHALVVLLDWQTRHRPGGQGGSRRNAWRKTRCGLRGGRGRTRPRARMELAQSIGLARGQMNRCSSALPSAASSTRERRRHERLQARLLDFANAAMLWGPAHVDEVTTRGRGDARLGPRQRQPLPRGGDAGLLARSQRRDARTHRRGRASRSPRRKRSSKTSACCCGVAT